LGFDRFRYFLGRFFLFPLGIFFWIVILIIRRIRVALLEEEVGHDFWKENLKEKINIINFTSFFLN
jgi:hypothetical protein